MPLVRPRSAIWGHPLHLEPPRARDLTIMLVHNRHVEDRRWWALSRCRFAPALLDFGYHGLAVRAAMADHIRARGEGGIATKRTASVGF